MHSDLFQRLGETVLAVQLFLQSPPLIHYLLNVCGNRGLMWKHSFRWEVNNYLICESVHISSASQAVGDIPGKSVEKR